MKKNFQDEWDKITSAQQEAVRKKAQKKIDSGYDANKIKNHIENNFTTIPKQNTSNNNTGIGTISNTAIGNSNNSFGNTNNISTNRQANTGMNNNYNNSLSNNNSIPSYSESKVQKQSNQNTMLANYEPLGIPGLNILNLSTKIPKQNNTVLKTPKIDTSLGKTPSKSDFGIDKNKRKFQMTDIQKDQRVYMDLIEKRRQAEGFPKNAPRTGLISEFYYPNWRGGIVRMTEEEYDNMPSSMNAKEKEQLKYFVNQKGVGSFDSHWEKIKDVADTIPKEVEGLTRELFNKLSDDEKLKFYNFFVQYERKQKEEQEKQAKAITKQERIENERMLDENKGQDNGGNFIKANVINTEKPKLSGVSGNKINLSELKSFSAGNYNPITGAGSLNNSNNNENLSLNNESIIESITEGTKKTVDSFKNTGSKVIDSIGSSILNIYDEAKGDIEKIKNIPINVGIMVEDYYNEYVLGEEKIKEQEKWKNMTSQEFIKSNEGRVWYFDTVVGENIDFKDVNSLVGHAGLYFIKDGKEYMVDFYAPKYSKEDLLLNKPIYGENWNSSGKENTSAEILRGQIQGKGGVSDKDRFITGLEGKNFDIGKMVAYYNIQFGNGNIPDYRFLTDNCSSEVENILRLGGYFNDNNLVDFPLRLRNQVMLQELKNKFIGNNLNTGTRKKK